MKGKGCRDEGINDSDQLVRYNVQIKAMLMKGKQAKLEGDEGRVD